jgi:hypothetical protein
MRLMNFSRASTMAKRTKMPDDSTYIQTYLRKLSKDKPYYVPEFINVLEQAVMDMADFPNKINENNSKI